jgi:hypothetical protein
VLDFGQVHPISASISWVPFVCLTYAVQTRVVGYAYFKPAESSGAQF